MKKVRIGAGSAGWPDLIHPALEVAEKGNVDYIGFDHLAELTMAILQKMRARDPNRGYIPDIVPLFRRLLPIWEKTGRHFKMISDGGGANPVAAGNALVKIAEDLGLTGMKIGVVTGDDIPISKVDELRAKGLKFKSLDTGEEDIDSIRDRLIGAYAYIGGDRIIEALGQGADIVIGGRFSDNSMYVCPMIYEFGWKFEEPYWDLIGSGVALGHLVECAGWSAGFGSNLWKQNLEPWRNSFPIIEVAENGEAIITKVPGPGGLVKSWTIKEHLVYEVHDPANYIMPDGIADFTTVQLEDVGENMVKATGIRGKPRPENLKFMMGYDDGYIAEGTAVLAWPDAVEKAKRAETFVRELLKIEGLEPRDIHFGYVGINSLMGPGAPWPDYEMNEVGLRVAMKVNTREEARIARLVISMLWGGGGIGTSLLGNALSDRQVIGLWPTLIPRAEVPTTLTMMEVK